MFSEPPKSRLFCCDRFSALNPDVGKPPSGSTAEMVVVIHQAIGIDLNLRQPGHVGEQVEKSLASFVFDEDITAGLAPVHDVIIRGRYSIRNGLAMPTFYRKSRVNS